MTREFRVLPTPPWRSLAGLTIVLGLGVSIVVCDNVQPSAGPTRMALRLDCADAAGCARAEGLALDVWSEHRGPGDTLDVVVSSDDLADLHVPFSVIDPDIDASAEAEAARLRDPSAADKGDFFSEYKDYGAITARLDELAAGAPELVHKEEIGRSIEGRPIWAVRIGGSAPDATPMMINGTQHAREWIAAMVTTCVADRLVRGYATDPAIRAFVDRTELWVVPVVNPDGYQHSWGSNRYWRKNRRGGHGVDLNRNFSVAWGGEGSSKRERSDTYHGLHAFSEPETRAVRDLALRERARVHVDFHAYGQLLLYPWAYTRTPPTDRARYAATGDRLASAMFATHRVPYKLQSGAELYAAAGTMSDWAHGEAGAMSFTIELRPSMGGRGAGGFVLPPAQIKPTCDEGMAAVFALRDAAP